MQPLYINNLPPALSATLQRATRRIKRIVLLRGLFAVIATALLALLAIIAIDAALVLYSQTLRIGLSLIGLGAVLWVATRHLVRPLLQSYSPARIATIIEQRHPELEERLSTVVQLLSIPETSERGSEQLVALITEAAEADARTISPVHEFTGRTIRPKLVVAGVATGILILLFAAWPTQLRLLCLRALAPFAELDNLFATHLTVTPGNVTMLVGEPLEVNVSVNQALQGQAYLRKRATNAFFWQRETPERMRLLPADEGTPENQRHFRQLFPAVEGSFRYRIACNYALTRYYTVTAVHRPEAEIQQIRYVFPPYTGKPDRIETNDCGEIAALIGTEITIDARLNRPAELSGTFIAPPHSSDITPSKEAQLTKRFSMSHACGPHWGIELKDHYGFTNAVTLYPLRAIEDRPPTIQLTRPVKRTIRIAKRGHLSLAYQITDDYGITNALMEVASDEEVSTTKIPLRTLIRVDNETWEGSQTLDLRDEQWATTKKLRVQLTVSDQRTEPYGEPQIAKSHILVIEFDDGARSIESQSYQEQAEKIKESIKELTEQLRESERESAELRQKMDNRQELNQQDQQKLDDIRNDLAEAEQKVEDLVNENKASAFKPIAEKLETLNQKQIEEARKTAEQAQQAQRQAPQIRSLEKQLEDAMKTAEELRREAENFARKLDKLAALDELATREDMLAQDAPETDTASEMNDWRQQQEDIRNQFNHHRGQLPEAHQQDPQRNQENARQAQEKKSARARLEQARDTLKEMAEQAYQLSETQEALAQTQHERTDQYDQMRNKPDAETLRAENKESIQQQREVAKEAQSLARKAEAIRQDLQRLNQPEMPVSSPLQQAEHDLNQAHQRGQEAAQNMEHQPTHPHESTWRQDDATRALERAAVAFEQAQRQADQMMDRLEADIAAQEQREAAQDALSQANNPEATMNEAIHDAVQARQSKEQEDRAQQNPNEQLPEQSSEAGMQAAAEHAKDAAEQLRQLVDAAAAQMNVPTEFLPSRAAERTEPSQTPPRQPGQQPGQQALPLIVPHGVPLQIPDAIKAQLPDQEWFKLKGEAKSQAMDDALRRVPAEYRDLVRLYFQELSKEAEK